MPRRAIDDGSGMLEITRTSRVASTGVVKIAPVDDVKDQLPPANVTGPPRLSKLNETAPPVARLEVKTKLTSVPLTIVAVPGGADRTKLVMLPPVPANIMSRSLTATPVLLFRVTSVTNPARLGVVNAKLASTPKAKAKKSDWLFMVPPSIDIANSSEK
jgi:hypothetical protein